VLALGIKSKGFLRLPHRWEEARGDETRRDKKKRGEEKREEKRERERERERKKERERD